MHRQYSDEDSDYLDSLEKHLFKTRPDECRGKSWAKWTIDENIQYLEFLQNNKHLFHDEFTRRSTRVFLKLSKHLKHRNPDQCRTHHQKMHSKCQGNIENIIELTRHKILANLRRRANKNDKSAKARLIYYESTKKLSKEKTRLPSNTASTATEGFDIKK